jgi:hypothetical protein
VRTRELVRALQDNPHVFQLVLALDVSNNDAAPRLGDDGAVAFDQTRIFSYTTRDPHAGKGLYNIVAAKVLFRHRKRCGQHFVFFFSFVLFLLECTATFKRTQLKSHNTRFKFNHT